MDNPTIAAHVIIFPLAAQGHVNSMLKLAELLCLENIHVTFLVSQNTLSRLSNYSNVESRFKNYPFFKFEAFPNEIYEGNPHTDEALIMLFESVRETTKPFLKELLVQHKREGSVRPPVSCIIADGILGFTIDVAKEMGVPIIYFRTISSCAFWSFFSIPQLIKAEELPFKGSDMDMPIANVKGMESFLRQRDLPSFCRSSGLSGGFNMVLRETQETAKTEGLILNTFEDLEGPILSQIRTHCPNIYTIGPLHAHLKANLQITKPNSSSNSLWEEDRTCIDWLDKQPSKSVLYVSFGSITVLTRDQLFEFWHGIINSGIPFLWVIRPESIIMKVENENDIDISKKLEEGSKGRGHIIKWAPQEEVLGHEAIGGFLTHSGWNSTLESIVEGVPMICWPFFADQQTNSRFVGEVWKLGLDIKDTCDRAIIEKAIREIMEVKKEEFQVRANKMATFAKDSVRQGGSSSQNLKRLVHDIRSKAINLK